VKIEGTLTDVQIDPESNLFAAQGTYDHVEVNYGGNLFRIIKAVLNDDQTIVLDVELKEKKKLSDEQVFSGWLQKELKKRRLTGGELAERAKVSRSAAYFYIDGKRLPGPDALKRICDALGVSIEDAPKYEAKRVGQKKKLPV